MMLVPMMVAVAASLPGAELQVPTPFEVRRELTELVADLAKAGPGDEGPLLERAAQVLAAHGAEPADASDGARPLADVVMAALAHAHLDQRFVEVYGERALRTLAGVPWQDLARQAASFPGTPAAQAAWKRLADAAWDRGFPGLSAAAQRRAGAGDPAWRARAALALQLATPPALPEAPAQLGTIHRAWTLSVPLRGASVPDFVRRRRAAEHRPATGPIVLGSPVGEASILTDGQRVTVIDHLVGRIVGEPITLAPQATREFPAQPVALADGWVVVGVNEQRLHLVRCERQGGTRWKATSADVGYGVQISDPVVLDGQVMVGMLATDGESVDVRVMAWSLEDGRLRWNTLVGRGGGMRMWGGDGRASLHLAVHDGALAFSGDFGALVRVASDGRVERTWTYRREAAAPGIDEDARLRKGSLASDGRWLVMAPPDQPGVLLLQDGASDPVTYRGDGAGSEVLAIQGGTAWLGGSRLLALDVATRSPHWDAAVAASAVQPGPTSLLVTARDALVVLQRSNGAVVDRLPTPEPVAAMATLDGWLVTARPAEDGVLVNAWGDPGPARERLTVAANQGSWNAAAALASLSSGSGHDEEAIAWYLTALRLGAPRDYARRCASLLRRRFDQPLSEEERRTTLERFAQVVQHDGGLAGEFALHRARATTDPEQRRAALAQAQQGPPGLVDGPAGIAVDVRVLAACAAGTPPTWPEPTAQPLPPGTPWQRLARRAPGSLVGGGRIVGYADGVLTAIDATNGAESWWRKPARPLLGVQSSADDRGDGVRLGNVLPGSAAAAAGLRKDDVVLRLNDHELHSFTGDLMPVVVALGVRGAFTADIRRGEERLQCRGVLGGELVQPVAIDDHTVLVWPANVLRTNGPLQVAPEGLWVEAYDLARGERRWRQAIAPASTDGTGPLAPILVAGCAVLADGPDLIARDAASGREQWRLPGFGSHMAGARSLGGLLWISDDLTGHLVNPADGALIARIAGGGQATLLAGQEVFLSGKGEVRRCDLTQARTAWTAEGIARLVAVAGDGVWGVSTAGPLALFDRASGRERRRYGDWPAIAGERVIGAQLIVHATPGPDRSTVAAIALAGGAVTWQLGMPPGSDVVGLEDDGQGPAVVLADRQGPTAVVHLDALGTLRGLTPVQAPQGTRVVPTADGALLLGPEGATRVAREDLASAPRPWIPGQQEDLPGVGRVRVSMTTGSLRVVWTPTAKALDLAIADAGEALAAGATRLSISERGEVTTVVAGTAWTAIAKRDGNDVIIDLLTSRLAGAPVLLHLADAAQPTARWWWTRTWRVVTGAR